MPRDRVLLAALWLLPDHPRVAGALFALAALLQVFPGLLLVYALLSRQRQVLWGAVITSAICVVGMLWLATGSLLPMPLGILNNGLWAVRFQENQAFDRLPVGILLIALVLVLWASAT